MSSSPQVVLIGGSLPDQERLEHLLARGAPGTRVTKIPGPKELFRDPAARHPEELPIGSAVESVTEYGIVLLGSDGRVRSWPSGAQRITGITDVEAVGRPYVTVFRAEDPGKAELPVLAHTPDAETVEFNGVRVRKGGDPTWVHELYYVLRNDERAVTGYLLIVHDLTTRLRTLGALRESEQRYRRLVERSPEPIFIYGYGGVIEYANPAAAAMLGIEVPAALIGRSVLDFAHPDDREIVRARIRQVVEGGKAADLAEIQMRRPDGQVVVLEVVSSPIVHQGKPAAQAMGRDVTLRKRVEQSRVHDLLHDGLTGLPSRNLFAERLSHAAAVNRRRHEKTFALIVCNIDRFKLINDSLGHAAGDELLREFAQRLRSSVRPTDSVARLAGDEFAVLLEELSEPSEITHVVERIRRGCSGYFRVAHRQVYVSASIGVVVSDLEAHPDVLLRNASIALYRAKESEHPGYAFFDRQMHQLMVERLDLESQLRATFEQRRFEVYYQPIISLQDGQLAGFEALLRWPLSSGGFVPPSQFIPIAEEMGIILQLDWWVLESACRQIHRWQGMMPDRRLTVSVNLSGRQFAFPGLLETLQRVLSETGVDSMQLKLEITESVLVRNAESVGRMLSRLREMNVSMLIDDFGTGYSSLSYLGRLPIDALKIDRSFLSRDAENDAIVQAVVGLAHNLGLSVVAEGLETKERVRQLRELGCDYGQGFLFSHPLQREAAEALLSGTPQWLSE